LVTSNDATSNASENTAHDKVDGEHQKMRHGPDGKLTYQAVTNFLSSSSDLASSTSFFDDDETENDMEKMKQENYYDYDENLTEYSSILSSQQNSRLKIRKKPQRRKKRPNQQMSRTSSYSSITDSTMSLNIITVQINMDTVNFLGTLRATGNRDLTNFIDFPPFLSRNFNCWSIKSRRRWRNLRGKYYEGWRCST
jgi:hypothetical protein